MTETLRSKTHEGGRGVGSSGSINKRQWQFLPQDTFVGNGVFVDKS